jgi:Na+/H+-translocating membrane pyrophosphatase
MQLISTNLGGNLHDASDTINRMGLAEFVIALDFSGSNTIAVFRVSDEMAPEVRKYFRKIPEAIANKKPERVWK